MMVMMMTPTRNCFLIIAHGVTRAPMITAPVIDLEYAAAHDKPV